MKRGYPKVCRPWKAVCCRGMFLSIMNPENCERRGPPSQHESKVRRKKRNRPTDRDCFRVMLLDRGFGRAESVERLPGHVVHLGYKVQFVLPAAIALALVAIFPIWLHVLAATPLMVCKSFRTPRGGRNIRTTLPKNVCGCLDPIRLLLCELLQRGFLLLLPVEV